LGVLTDDARIGRWRQIPHAPGSRPFNLSGMAPIVKLGEADCAGSQYRK
jgi:hypothetical protein